MVQYIVILLDDTSVSFCHYPNVKVRRHIMPIETLRAGVLYAMKENLNVQFVYPDYELPEEYDRLIDTIDHIKIKPTGFGDADITVMDGLEKVKEVEIRDNMICALRLTKDEMFNARDIIKSVLEKALRLNIILTDIDTFREDDFAKYKDLLAGLCEDVEQMYINGKAPQLNILTDRMMLDKMNNCGAGDTCITLAPDGQFYVCPAFYGGKDGYAIGSLDNGLDIKNAQLYKLDHAPICRKCDAYQCRRCIWLNRKTTLEVNIPSHEQCVVAHIERNAARKLLLDIRTHGRFLPEMKEIEEIEYLDPFETIRQ